MLPNPSKQTGSTWEERGHRRVDGEERQGEKYPRRPVKNALLGQLKLKFSRTSSSVREKENLGFLVFSSGFHGLTGGSPHNLNYLRAIQSLLSNSPVQCPHPEPRSLLDLVFFITPRPLPRTLRLPSLSPSPKLPNSQPATSFYPRM